MKCILKYYSSDCQNQLIFPCFLGKLGLYDCPVHFPCLFPELLTNINQIQHRILNCVTSTHIPCQYKNKLRSAPLKKVCSVAATRQKKVTVLQALCFYKAVFCVAACWPAKRHAKRCGCMERLRGLLVIQWHGSGHQGALMLCTLVRVAHWGSPLPSTAWWHILGGLQVPSERRFPSAGSLNRSLSRLFIWGVGGVRWYFSVRENQSFKFLQVLQQLDLVSTLAVFYLGISPLAHTGSL